MANCGTIACAAILAIVALSASPATALDGEVLISQQSANAGGITPGDNPGFPITIRRTGKYKLIGNLNVPAGRNGINVTANYVTIDLNGFRIAGGVIGINASNRNGLTVMNGTIRNATSQGIDARNFAVVQDMQITNNGGMGVKLRNNGRVLRSTISRNNSVNIYCVSRCLIAGNVITESVTESGIGLFTTAGGHLVLNNVIANNHLFAIYAEGKAGYANNTVTGNGTYNNSSIVGDVNAVHPNYCQPACP
jgi:hypothetical protein